MEALIQEWLKNELSSVEIRRPLTCHIDQLLNRKVKQSDWILLSCEAYKIVLNQIQPVRDKYMAVLVISLSPVEKLDVDYPTPELLLQQLHDARPPEIGILDRDTAKYLWPFEEHVYPIEWEVFEAQPSSFYVTYSVQRDLQSIQEGWEYNRYIFVEDYLVN